MLCWSHSWPGLNYFYSLSVAKWYLIFYLFCSQQGFFLLFWKTNAFPWRVQHQTAPAASNIFCSCWEQGSSVVWLRSHLCITEVRDHTSGENVTCESTNKDKDKKYGNSFPCSGNEVMVTKGQLHSWSKASSKSKWHSTVYCYRLTARAKRAT